MKSLETIDLHMHSTVSDGTDTPEELLERVKEKGLTLFALTDQDDPVFLSGVEFSCKDEEGKYHILGYNYDPDAEAIQNVVDLGHSLRMKKVQMRLDFLKEHFGFEFPKEEIRTLLALDNPGKPHIGNLMVKLGYADTKETAIREYINKLRMRSEYVRPEQAIEGILKSGGIPVLAHPCYGSGDELILGEELEQRVCKLMNFGLQGVETFYSGFPRKLREEVLSLAEKYGLYVTAGSDYHGKNKLIRLGTTGLSDSTPAPDGLLRFLNEVHFEL